VGPSLYESEGQPIQREERSAFEEVIIFRWGQGKQGEMHKIPPPLHTLKKKGAGWIAFLAEDPRGTRTVTKKKRKEQQHGED